MLSLRRLLQIIGVVSGQLILLVYLRLRGNSSAHLPASLRKILERLGGAFIKLGQLLAMRPDILPPEYIAELSFLLDSAPQFPGEIAAGIVERELGRPVQEIFTSFSVEPIAAASFAQVHRATLKSGEPVVVKVQRPGLPQLARADLRIFAAFAHLVDFLGLLKRFRLTRLSDEFTAWTLEELDFRIEATYSQRLRDLCKGDPSATLPKIYWEYTTQVILTMDYLDGVWVSEILDRINRDGLEAAATYYLQSGIRFDQVAANILSNALSQAFEYMLFHADPHAGNLVVLRGNVIGYVDFGITGELDAQFRATQLFLYDALHKRNYHQYVTGIYRLLKPPSEDVDLDAFESEIYANVRRWQNVVYNPLAGLQERSSSWLIMRNLRIIRKYGLEISSLAIRYFRAISVVELIILRLQPRFDFVGALSTYLKQLQLREVARRIRMESRMERLLTDRRLIEEFMSDLEMRFNASPGSGTVLLSRVSRFQVVWSDVFQTLAILAAAAILVIPIGARWFPRLALLFALYGWKRLILGLLLCAIVFAWASRKLYIDSARHGVVPRSRG